MSCSPDGDTTAQLSGARHDESATSALLLLLPLGGATSDDGVPVGVVDESAMTNGAMLIAGFVLGGYCACSCAGGSGIRAAGWAAASACSSDSSCGRGADGECACVGRTSEGVGVCGGFGGCIASPMSCALGPSPIDARCPRDSSIDTCLARSEERSAVCKEETLGRCADDDVDGGDGDHDDMVRVAGITGTDGN